MQRLEHQSRGPQHSSTEASRTGTITFPSSSTGVNQNTTFSIPAVFSEPQALGNFDYVINSKNTLSGRWFYGPDTTTAPMACGTGGSSDHVVPSGRTRALYYSTQYVVLKLTSILSPNLVNEARVSVQRAVATSAKARCPSPIPQVGITPIVPSNNAFNKIVINGLFQIQGVGMSDSWTDSTECGGPAFLVPRKTHHSHRPEFEKDAQNRFFPGLSIGSVTFTTFQDFLLGLPGCAPTLSPAQCSGTARAAGAYQRQRHQQYLLFRHIRRRHGNPAGEFSHFRAPAAPPLFRMTSR